MSELIAQGTKPDRRWRRPLPSGQTIVLGRTTVSFRVPWDDRISREHVQLELVGTELHVQKLPSASNPVFFNGQPADQFSLQPGEHFVIGKTTFSLAKEQAQATLDLPQPIRERTFSTEFLRGVHFRNAEQRIDVLNRLPDVISSAGNEQDLLNRLSNTLLAGIPAASTVGIVRQQHGSHDNTPATATETETETETDPLGSSHETEIEIIHWDRRDTLAGDFQPSEKLIRQAIGNRETVLHLWQPSNRNRHDRASEFTFDLENDWAFVCPLDSVATPGWGIYVTGSQSVSSSDSKRDSDGEDLQGDVKFCELVGAILKNLLLVRQLERRQASLRGFFSPLVLDALVGRDAEEVLAPQQVPMSVLFCDLRGFSKKSEAMADELFALLRRVSQSLDVVTNSILSHSGVIGDFHGDSVMGFWGWPLQQLDTALRAVQAALAIKSKFHTQPSIEHGFQIGIGIATGIAVAGKIGTRDQVKVTAFGPVVNLAARLEGMNRMLNSAMLIDRATMEQVVQQSPERSFQFRALGKFQPFGLSTTTDVFQVLDESDRLSNAELEQFERALSLFQNGDWRATSQLLGTLPSQDAGKRFLTEFMTRTNQLPPANWNGVIEIQSK